MIINQPQNMRTDIKSHVCDFHKNNPDKNYAGCTCSTSYSMSKKETGNNHKTIEKCNSIEEWLTYANEFSPPEDIFFITRLREKGFNDDQILDILHVVDNTCPHCLDGPIGCKCWNDE